MQLQRAVRRCFEFVFERKHHEASAAIRYKNIKRVPLASCGVIREGNMLCHPWSVYAQFISQFAVKLTLVATLLIGNG